MYIDTGEDTKIELTSESLEREDFWTKKHVVLPEDVMITLLSGSGSVRLYGTEIRFFSGSSSRMVFLTNPGIYMFPINSTQECFKCSLNAIYWQLTPTALSYYRDGYRIITLDNTPKMRLRDSTDNSLYSDLGGTNLTFNP